MSNEEKILEMLSQMRVDISEMRGDISEMRGDISKLQNDVTRINLRLELDVEKRFDAVNKGIDTILDTMAPKRRVEELEDDVIVLKNAVRMLAKDVAELKKAQ